MNPNATTGVEAEFNLDSRLAVPSKTPFDATDSGTFNYSNSIGPVYDSLGNPHELTAYFVKTGANAWDVYGPGRRRGHRRRRDHRPDLRHQRQH